MRPLALVTWTVPRLFLTGCLSCQIHVAVPLIIISVIGTPPAYWQLHLLKSSYVTVTRELAAVSCRITWGSRIGCVHTTRMGCAGSKEPKEPELNSNRDEATSLDGINVAEKPGVSLQRKKSSQVGRTSPDAERCHARRLTSVAPHPCGPARAARPSRALPAPSLLIASLPAPSGTKRCRVGRPVSGAWA